jgi:predicted glycogen debranching enzyme
MPTRKYHGLFVPNLSAPKGRFVMISRCDEEVLFDHHRIILGGAEFESGNSVGLAHRYLREFRFDHRIATWLYEFNGTVLEKSLVMPHNQNIVCVKYRLLAGSDIELRVRPFMTFRRHDDPPSREPSGPFTLNVCRGRHEVHLADSPLVLRLSLRPAPTIFVCDEFEGIDFLYRIERRRGDPYLESAYSPGYFRGYVTQDQPLAFVATTQGWSSLDFDLFETFDAERKRMDTLLARGSHLRGDDFAEQLAMAADQFVVLPGSRLEENVLAAAEGTELRTVIAGYHWFGDWGRDTMISLEGLTLCTCRYREASAILRTFAHYVRDGLLPNLFPEGERQALYHTVDATLWYFHAIDRYVTLTGDTHLVLQLYPVLASIIEHHLRGTHYDIHADPSDALISVVAEGYQLTWMDAKMGDWVVTPRRGKPVEIQALWYNALRLMALWSAQPAAVVRDSRPRLRGACRTRAQCIQPPLLQRGERLPLRRDRWSRRRRSQHPSKPGVLDFAALPRAGSAALVERAVRCALGTAHAVRLTHAESHPCRLQASLPRRSAHARWRLPSRHRVALAHWTFHRRHVEARS